MRTIHPLAAAIVAFAMIPSPAHGCIDLDPVPDPSGLASPLVLSEIDPSDYIELFNPGSTPIDLGQENYWLFSRPNAVDLRLHAAGTVVPAGGYALIPFPDFFLDHQFGGEIVLYRDIETSADFYVGNRIVDFVCWGSVPHPSVKVVAESIGRWSGNCGPFLAGGAIHRLVETDGASADSYDTTASPSPADCSEDGLDTLTPDGIGRKRLLHFQTVGWSSAEGLGLVSPNICNPVDGWNAHVELTLAPLVERLGPGTFDWWGHNPGGIWPETHLWITDWAFSTMRFSQLALARESFPTLVDYEPLADFASANDIGLYGYVGLPLCDVGGQFIFEPVPEHCDPDYFMEWYGEFVQFGFRGIGHDFSGALPAFSLSMVFNFPMLQDWGIEVFIEPVPWRGNGHLLGYSVVAEWWSWQNSSLDSVHRYSEQEILAAGGRAIQLVLRPQPGTTVEDLAAWRYETARTLLANGHTVAVPLDNLAFEGYPIEQLVKLSLMKIPATGLSAPPQ